MGNDFKEETRVRNIKPKIAIDPLSRAEVEKHHRHGATVDAIVERMRDHTALDTTEVEEIISKMPAEEQLKPTFVDRIEPLDRSRAGQKGNFNLYHAFRLPIGLLMKTEYAPGRTPKRITDSTELWIALHDENEITIEKERLPDMMSQIPEDAEKQLEEQLEIQATEKLKEQLSGLPKEEQEAIKEEYKRKFREDFFAMLPEHALPISEGIKRVEAFRKLAKEMNDQKKAGKEKGENEPAENL